MFVCAVELTDANKAAQELKVDAGNAAILAVEAGGTEQETADQDWSRVGPARQGCSGHFPAIAK